MKNKTKRIVGIACAILLVVLVQAIGITYAKYIASEKGSGQAEIAQWSFQIVKDGVETKTVNLADTVNDNTLVDGKIAPGTSGTINIQIDATGSDVNVDYKIEFDNEQNKPENLYFICATQRYNSLSEIVESGKIKYNEETKTRELVVLWYWSYETGTTDEEKATNNIKDTEYANANTEYTFDIIVTGTQSE